MKLKLKRPLYQGQDVIDVGQEYTTTEQHGRELIRKGYAEQVEDKPAEKKTRKTKSED